MFRNPDIRKQFFMGCGLAVGVLASLGCANAATVSVIYSFKGGSDGRNPYAGLAADSAGNLYATTGGGGADNWGTIVKLATNGTESVIYTFTGGSDGANPYGSLLTDKLGNLYSTTFYGGTAPGSSGLGTVLKLTPDGKVSVLHAFTTGTDGANPQAGLTRAGNYYSTTEEGGAHGYGAVVEVSIKGVETVLYSFTGGSDGANPFGGLIVDKAGNFYGTTEEGGTTGNGTVFKLAANGTLSTLYTFKGGSDGANPYGGLVSDSSGNLYSTTFYGGGTSCGGMGCGTVFKLAPDGTETVLHSFKGGSDGSYPEAGLTKDNSGNLYGTSFQGGGTGCGGFGCGTVFEVPASGSESVLHGFAGGTDGAFPTASLLRIGKELYGTTIGGGANNSGTIFKLPE